MGKQRDIIQILVLILIGMFIPFLGSVTLTYGLDLKKIGVTFGYFIIIFGIELSCVYLYFAFGNKRAVTQMEKYKPKKEEADKEQPDGKR